MTATSAPAHSHIRKGCTQYSLEHARRKEKGTMRAEHRSESDKHPEADSFLWQCVGRFQLGHLSILHRRLWVTTCQSPYEPSCDAAVIMSRWAHTKHASSVCKSIVVIPRSFKASSRPPPEASPTSAPAVQPPEDFCGHLPRKMP